MHIYDSIKSTGDSKWRAGIAAASVAVGFVSLVHYSLIFCVSCDKIYDLIDLLCGARSPGTQHYTVLMVGSNFYFIYLTCAKYIYDISNVLSVIELNFVCICLTNSTESV